VHQEERKKNRRNSSSAPELLGNLLASLDDAIVVTDENDRILMFNQAAEHLTGLPQAQVLHRHLAQVFRATPRVAEMVERTRSLAQSQSCGEELLAVGRRRLPVRLSCSPIRQGDQVQGAALVIQDLSYQKKLEDEARRNETLARLGAVVAGLAHEVKNPLGGIRGAAQLLAKRFADEPEVCSYTGVMIREIDRLTHLVEQLLAMGSPRPPEIVPLNVHEVLGEVIELMTPELESQGVSVRWSIDPSLPDVRGDARQLTQVFLNLVKNALEAMPQAGTLTLTTRMETDFHIRRRDAVDRPSAAAESVPGKFLRVDIGDTGSGFAPGEAKRIFEPFYSTKTRGTGLGLAICERIIAVHGGDIQAHNATEGGGVVSVTLPIAGT
jgi:two-component system nitrogen regulation sensor histidine kinase GlnL